jgi:hypothetical protein
MSATFDNYMTMLINLDRVRSLYKGLESDAEDKLLDEMDAAWQALTDEEREKIQALPSSTTLPHIDS